MKVVLKRFFLDRAHVIRRVGKARAKVLRGIGAMVMRSSRGQIKAGTMSRSIREIGAYRAPGQPAWQRLPLLEQRNRRSRPGRVQSYKTPRNAKGFLKTSVAFAYDFTTQSVVIGPAKKQSAYSPRLYQLQEEGGTARQTLYLRNRGRPVPAQVARRLKRTGNRSQYVYVGSFFDTPPSPMRATWRRTNVTRSVNVRKGRYQLNGLKKVLPKIPSQWRDKIRGP